ncbi:MAG: LysE family translocator [Hahellaceae bacterium]|nr:LysE family translocator [Hahellaceae bacterium]
MSAESALTFFLAIFIFGITPGPGVFALLSRALSRGKEGCVWLALGMAVSDALYLITACLGLAAVAQKGALFFLIIQTLGSVYLFYLAACLWRADAPPLSPPTQQPLRRDSRRALLQGMLISGSNPKVILFYLAFLPGFLDLGALAITDIVLAAVLTITALMAGLMLIVSFAVQAREKLRSPGSARTLNRIAAIIMSLAGLYLAIRMG